jgi:hypothetical protein
MCYTRRDQGFEEEARRLRAEEERHEEKPVTRKVKEMVGAR